MGHDKHFVIPNNVSTFSIHHITKGKSSHELNTDEIYFNHYIFLNKSSKLQTRFKGSGKTDDSIMKHVESLFTS